MKIRRGDRPQPIDKAPQGTGSRMGRRGKTGKTRKRLLGGCMAALAAGGLVLLGGWCAARLERWQMERYRPSPAAASAVSGAEAVLPETAEELLAQQQEAAQRARFAGLLEQNEDAVGWISIEGTSIDLPLVQGSDNVFYLDHGLDRQPDRLGVPFVDYECDLRTGQHLILYGHNMSNSSTERFSELRRYRQPEYCSEHPVIQLDTLYASQLYKVVAVYVITAQESDGDVFHFNQYVQFADDAAWQDYLDAVAQRAFYTVDGYAQPGERLLSLCTCMHTMENDRIIVMARPLREGESAEADRIEINPAPLLPARWPADG